MLNIIKAHNVIVEEPSLKDKNDQDEVEYTYETLKELDRSKSEASTSPLKVPSLAELNGGVSEDAVSDSEESKPVNTNENEENETIEPNENREDEIVKVSEDDKTETLEPSTKKLVDEEELNLIKQQIIDEAMAQKEEILKKAHEEAAEILKQSVEQGIKDGINISKKEISEKIAQWSDEITYLADIQERKLMEINRKVTEISVDVAEKIIGIRMEFDPLTLLPLTKEAVASLDTDEKITIYLSKKMPELLEAVRSEFLGKSNIKVKSQDDLSSDGVMLETVGEILDASVYTQLQNLKKQLQRLNFEDGEN